MEKITVVECGPLEGAKLLHKDTALKDKVDLINKLTEGGITKIVTVSFTHPRLMPQFSDAEELMKSIDKKSGVTYVGLTPNEIACRRAVNTAIDEILVAVAASDTYNQVTVGQSLREVIHKLLPSVIKIALNEGKGVRAYITASFGCPYEGNVAISEVADIASKLDFLGVNQISLSDSAGVATPVSVREVVSALIKTRLKAELAVHFHDTRGLALVNAMAAFESGIRIFDTAVAGMSARPFGAPNELTNWTIPTEDLVNMFESMGVRTGIDMNVLLSCVSRVEGMLKRRCPGHILRAGVNNKLFQAPEKVKMRRKRSVSTGDEEVR